MNGYDETKYISCKGCGCEIEADQRKCPYCKTINLSAPKKNSNKLLVIVPTALLVIAAVVVFLMPEEMITFSIRIKSKYSLFSTILEQNL